MAVFRGPRTTAQGRDSIAGAIFTETENPDLAAKGAGRLFHGNDSTERCSAALGGALVADRLAARAAFDRRDGTGSVKKPNVTAAGIGVDPRRDDLTVARAKLLATPSAPPGFCAPHLPARGGDGATGRSRERPVRATRRRGRDRRAVRHEGGQRGARPRGDFGGGLVWAYRLTFADIRTRRFTRPGNGVADVRATERSLETTLRLGEVDSRPLGLIGDHLFDSEQDEEIDLTAFPASGAFRDEQVSRAVSVEATYQATDRLSLALADR